MTNAEIIENTSLQLAEQGVLKMIEIDGVPMPEPIHTFNGWKKRGYSVKKGEKSNDIFNSKAIHGYTWPEV